MVFGDQRLDGGVQLRALGQVVLHLGHELPDGLQQVRAGHVALLVLLQEAHIVLHQAAEVGALVAGQLGDPAHHALLGGQEGAEHPAHLAELGLDELGQHEGAVPLLLGLDGGGHGLLVALHVVVLQAAVGVRLVTKQGHAAVQVQRVGGGSGNAHVTQPLSASAPRGPGWGCRGGGGPGPCAIPRGLLLLHRLHRRRRGSTCAAGRARRGLRARPAADQGLGAALRLEKRRLLLEPGRRDGGWFRSKPSSVAVLVMGHGFRHARGGRGPGQLGAAVHTINSGGRGPGWGGPRPLRAIRVGGSPGAGPLRASADLLAVHFEEQRINKAQGSVGLAALQLRGRPGFYRMHSIYKAELTRGRTHTVGGERPMGRWRVWGFVVSWRAPKI